MLNMLIPSKDYEDQRRHCPHHGGIAAGRVRDRERRLELQLYIEKARMDVPPYE